MGIFSNWWTKMKKTEPGIEWFLAALGLLIVGTILVSGLRYLDEHKYTKLILLADLVWMSGVAVCLWIGLWKMYQNREMRLRKLTLWVVAVGTLVATAMTFYTSYRLCQ